MLKSIKTNLIGIIGAATLLLLRLLPHLPSEIPLFALVALYNFHFGFRRTLFYVVGAFCLSDILLSFMHHWPVFGSYSLFTYSGLIGSCVLASRIRHMKRTPYFLLTSLGGGLGYWIWTNFGVWLSGSLYLHDASGIVQCYVAAIPFLTHSLIGNGGGALIILGLQTLSDAIKPRYWVSARETSQTDP